MNDHTSPSGQEAQVLNTLSQSQYIFSLGYVGLWALCSEFFLVWVIVALQVMLVSAAQQSESAICIHISPPSWSSHPPTPGHHRVPS